ncbi:DUF2384 domain-containing protein [Chroococcidiopsis sp. FACHB-1243]|uniref:type II RES/Xre toxin-antitoxin system antitoxin n=1 Tax=Chroococcidiopsis sp. [FACHB-1243] TaxID=2692781 RepID=UPI0017874AC3|nr:antitoxin Xre-like helix-turn-helix domain-containing protein [Chroococcidiopsis sp. [FACHB-1243]]MBD2305652.1 DUF2384 domain-containing protein [Chroococcidiopsis sp. [FACHB-1243]]
MVPNQIVDANLPTIQKLLAIECDRDLGLEPSQLIAAGVPVTAVVRLKQLMGLSDEEMAQAVGMSRRTLSRRIQQASKDATKRLSAVESDRLYRLARIVASSADVFGDETTALNWLKQPLSALKGQTPLKAIETEPGVRQVDLLLGRIEHGIFA